MVLTENVNSRCVKDIKKDGYRSSLLSPRNHRNRILGKIQVFLRGNFMWEESIEGPRFYKKDIFLKIRRL